MNVPAPAEPSSLAPCDDSELLRRYLDQHREAAFTELVQRHFGFVYRAALRQVGDPDLAKDVTQVVFTDLARKAGRLRHHPALIGWLHTSTRYAATHSRRARERQLRRDYAGYRLQEALTDDGVNWSRLQPVIDEALQTLAEEDRQAVLLRFFEGQPFGEIAARLALSEDAVRMRVNRALQKLGRALQKRGVSSTGAALAAALTAGAAETAPIALASQIASTALAIAAASGGTAAALAVAVKVGWGMTLAAAVLGAVFAIERSRARHRAEEQLAAYDGQRYEALDEIRRLQREVAKANQRASDEDADIGKLLVAVGSVYGNPAGTPLGGRPPYNFAEDRFQHAQRLVRDGHYQEALKELLWCYDLGMTRVSPMFGVDGDAVIDELGILAAKYEPARAAIEARLAVARRQFDAAWSDNSGFRVAELLRARDGNNHATLALYDSLPAGNPRRDRLGVYLIPDLVEAQRYADVVAARPYERAVRICDLEGTADMLQEAPEALKPALRNSVIERITMNVEVFAGAGDLAHAHDFAAKLVAFDHSPDALAALQAHAARAGHPEIAAVAQ